MHSALHSITNVSAVSVRYNNTTAIMSAIINAGINSSCKYMDVPESDSYNGFEPLSSSTRRKSHFSSTYRQKSLSRILIDVVGSL
jgi:hypothetical protein